MWIICSSFNSLAFPFYFSSIRSSLLLYAGLLPPLPISCLGWTFFELKGGISQLSWTLLSKGLYPMVGTSLMKVRSVFLNPGYDLLFFLVFSCLELYELYHLMVSTAKTAQKFCIQRQFFFVFKCEVHYSLLSP